MGPVAACVITFSRTNFEKVRCEDLLRTYVYEEKSEVDYIEGTRFPWWWIGQDVELPELKVGGDWAVVDVVR